MHFKKSSLRIRIFLSMILLILLTYVLIAIMTVFQTKKQTSEYNRSRFERKEEAIRLNVSYVLENASIPLVTENLEKIFYQRISEIASVHKVNVKMYDLEGRFLLGSENPSHSLLNESVGQRDLQELQKKESYRMLEEVNEEGKRLQASYTYIYDASENPIGILKLHYFQDNSVQEEALKEFLSRLGGLYVLLFVVAILIAYFLSSYITRSLKTIVDKMSATGLDKRNQKIVLGSGSLEIQKLVNAYNNMVDALEESAAKLAKSEREQAWREMAKQVAHEIKNPLTPMRLSVQSFQRRFDVTDPKSSDKLKEFGDTLIQQIDVMDSIATAFSDFAQMPSKQKETIEVVEIIRMAIDIFDKTYLHFEHSSEEIQINMDKNQLIRVVTNLLKNALHATETVQNPRISLSVLEAEKEVEIRIVDNGKGIEKALMSKVFEPRFTTKTSGMGLGLPMVRKIVEGYGGTISFSSQENEGTQFTVRIPKGFAPNNKAVEH